MKQSSVDDILKSSYDSGLITKIERVGDRTDLKEKAYVSDKPGLVFFYNIREKRAEFSKRQAIIVKNLALVYGDIINFYAFNLPTEPTYNDEGIIRYGDETRKEGVNDTPSLKIFSKFDLVKGETPEKNDGNIKGIDIFKGGPGRDFRIYDEWLPFSKEWIKTNVTEINREWSWRLNNSWNERKVFYSR